jgi:hypothetical protein
MKSDLSLASLDDLLEEVKSRTTAMVIIISKYNEQTGEEIRLIKDRGPISYRIGLISCLRDYADEIDSAAFRLGVSDDELRDII